MQLKADALVECVYKHNNKVHLGTAFLEVLLNHSSWNMGQIKLVCSFLLLGLLHQISGQTAAPNSTICKVLAYHDGNGNFRQVTSTSEIPTGATPREYPACCNNYVYKETPECNSECPSGSCVFGYCPDDEKANCECYDDDTYPENPEVDCIASCHSSEGSECTCHAGYTKDERTNLCVPTECHSRCSNGQCDQLGTCTCSEGYVIHAGKTGLCVPKRCDDDCLRGLCDSQGNCNCREGYYNLDKMSCERIVCPSFDTDHAVYCKSQCDSQCVHGTCTDAGSCICETGFKNPGDNFFTCTNITCPSSDILDTDFCKSECAVKCNSFGSCNVDGKCQCNDGYASTPENVYNCEVIVCPTKKLEHSNYCKADCESNCKNGICSLDGTCHCRSGYQSTAEDRFSCNEIV